MKSRLLRDFCLFFMALCCLGTVNAAEKYELRQGDTAIFADPATGTVKISLAGTEKQFSSSGVLWSFKIFDADTARRNTRPQKETRSVYWGDVWKPSFNEVNSKQAKLTGVEKANNTLTLKYRHELAEVSVCYEIKNNAVIYSGKIKNLGKEPICDFAVLPELYFELNKNETLIAPDQSCQGAEYSSVFTFSWSLTSAWNGFLIRELNNKGFIAVDNVQEIEKEYLMSSSSLRGDKSGKKLRYTNNMRIFARSGEERKTSQVVLHHFKTLRQWADSYVKLNFPNGMKTLREKLGAERFDKLSRAYLAPTYGRISQAGEFVKHAPGQYIVHPPAWMKHVPGNPSNWDVFPNYFPPAKDQGTMEELAAFIRSVNKSGQFFMPRNSFFYWGIGTDFDKKHNLAANAIVCEDGKPRTAKWAHPGYLVSPSAKPVNAELDRIYDKWSSMGANLYFTNVIAAIDPYNNRYDFHKDAPAPDQMYTMISRLMKRHGEKLPLFSEGGGFWQVPWQAGICEKPGWNKKAPLDFARSNPKRVTLVRAAYEVPLYLEHEYIRYYPTNTSYEDGPYSSQRISFSLAHGYSLKCGFFAGAEPRRKNLLLMRTIALLADKVQSRLYGKRLLNYRYDGNKVVYTNYGGNKVVYNPSEKTVPFKCELFAAEVAKDGFSFVSADKKVFAGIFESVNGKKFSEPLLLVVEKSANQTLRIYTPFADRSNSFTIGGKNVTVPEYKAVLSKTIPGVTLNLSSGAVTPDAAPAGVLLYGKLELQSGSNKPIKAAAYTGAIPLKLDWQAGQPLPAMLQKFQKSLEKDGLRLLPTTVPHVIKSPELAFQKNFYVEVIFRFNRELEEPVRFGEVNIIRAEAEDNSIFKRTIELRYHLFRDSLRSLASGSGFRYAGMDDRKFSWAPGKYYHIVFKYDGIKQTLTVNGVEIAKASIPGKDLAKNIPEWRLGDLTTDITFQLIRIGGN